MPDFNAEWARADAETKANEASIKSATDAYTKVTDTGQKRQLAADDAVRGALAAPVPKVPDSTLPAAGGAPKVDPKEFEGLGMAIIAMAMISGTRGNWMGASQALNGAMEGIIKGDQDAAAKQEAEFKQKFEAAKAHDEQALRKYEQILNNRRLTINEMLQQANLVATENEHAEVQAQARVKSIQGLQEAVEKRRTSLLALDERNQRWQAAREAKDSAKASITPEEVDFYARMAIGGDTTWKTNARGPGGQALLDAVNKRIPTMAAEYHINPGDIGTTRAMRAAITGAMKQVESRGAATDLFGARIEQQMPILQNIFDKQGDNGPLAANKAINALRDQFSDPGLSALRTQATIMAKEIGRLMTSGGLSQAQLHEGASQEVQQLLNENLTPRQAFQVMQLFRQDIQANKRANAASMEGLQAEMTGLSPGGSPALAGAGGLPSVDAIDAELRRRGAAERARGH
jgi:hypothetical protein